MKAIVNDLGIFTEFGDAWLVSDGNWQDNFIDKTTNPKRMQWYIESWQERVNTYNRISAHPSWYSGDWDM